MLTKKALPEKVISLINEIISITADDAKLNSIVSERLYAIRNDIQKFAKFKKAVGSIIAKEQKTFFDKIKENFAKTIKDQQSLEGIKSE